MKKSIVIDVPEIQKLIKSKHKKFLKDVGIFSRKISEDHQLFLTRLVARITRIIECFVEEKIIDEFTPYNLPYADSEYVSAFCLRKKDYYESIYLWTDGNIIVLGDSRLPLTNSGCESIRNIDIDNFDGIEFANILLDFIHRKIYSRKESYEQRIFGTSIDVENNIDKKT